MNIRSRREQVSIGEFERGIDEEVGMLADRAKAAMDAYDIETLKTLRRQCEKIFESAQDPSVLEAASQLNNSITEFVSREHDLQGGRVERYRYQGELEELMNELAHTRQLLAQVDVEEKDEELPYDLSNQVLTIGTGLQHLISALKDKKDPGAQAEIAQELQSRLTLLNELLDRVPNEGYNSLVLSNTRPVVNSLNIVISYFSKNYSKI